MFSGRVSNATVGMSGSGSILHFSATSGVE